MKILIVLAVLGGFFVMGVVLLLGNLFVKSLLTIALIVGTIIALRKLIRDRPKG